MAWQTADRVKETTTATGTGTVTLAGAMTGFQSFSAVCATGDTCYYGLQSVDGNGNPTGGWEVGVGTYTSSGNTLARSAVLASSSAGSAITLSGTTQVWLDMPAAALAPLVSSQISAPNPAGFIDGNFDFWSLATSFSLAAATDTYTADMWVCNAGTGGAATVSQNVAALGSEISGMVRPRLNRLAYQQTTNASTSPTIGQKIEAVGSYNGQTVTISGTFAAAAAASLIVGVQATQNFGTGGSPSTSVVTSQAVTWAIGTSEARFSAKLAIPSISGKTLGTGGNDFLRVDFLLATGATYTLYASQLQIDPCHASASANTAGSGGAPLPFRYSGVASEKVKVNNYLRIYPITAAAGFVLGALISPGLGATWILFDTPMRAAPAVSSTAAIIINVGSFVNTSFSLSATAKGWSPTFFGNSGVAWQCGYMTASSGGSGNLIFDARL